MATQARTEVGCHPQALLWAPEEAAAWQTRWLQRCRSEKRRLAAVMMKMTTTIGRLMMLWRFGEMNRERAAVLWCSVGKESKNRF